MERGLAPCFPIIVVKTLCLNCSLLIMTCCCFCFLKMSGKPRAAQFTVGDLPRLSFEALVQKVNEKFPGCPDPKDYEMRLKYKANGTWVAMKNTGDLVRALQSNSNNKSMNISANTMKRASLHFFPPEVPPCSLGNVASPTGSNSTVAMRFLVAGAAVTHEFGKRDDAEKKGSKVMSKQTKAIKKASTQKKARKKPSTSVAATIAINRTAGGDVEHRVLTNMAKFKMLKIDDPLRDHIIRLSGYKNIRSPGIGNVVKNLKKNGKIEFSSGERMRVLPGGMDHAAVEAVFANQPSNNAQVHEHIKLLLQSLVDGTSKVKTTDIFNLLVSDSEPHTIAELMELTGHTNARSPGFAHPLSIMNSLGLIYYPTKSTDIHKKTVQATKAICFPFDEDHAATA
jgi:hypothetical protein